MQYLHSNGEYIYLHSLASHSASYSIPSGKDGLGPAFRIIQTSSENYIPRARSQTTSRSLKLFWHKCQAEIPAECKQNQLELLQQHCKETTTFSLVEQRPLSHFLHILCHTRGFHPPGKEKEKLIMFSYRGNKSNVLFKTTVVRTKAHCLIGKHAVHIVDLKIKYAEYLCFVKEFWHGPWSLWATANHLVTAIKM